MLGRGLCAREHGVQSGEDCRARGALCKAAGGWRAHAAGAQRDLVGDRMLVGHVGFGIWSTGLSPAMALLSPRIRAYFQGRDSRDLTRNLCLHVTVRLRGRIKRKT